jgi:hypothetical protein
MTAGGQVRVAQELVPHLSDATPQPVALALGRVVRALGNAETVDACIKAAEVIARYVAMAALASAASTRSSSDQPPEVDSFAGNLSFGVFENAARASAAVPWDHPLRAQLRLCLRRRNAVAGQRLQAFVELRNAVGHAITHVDESRARTLIEAHDPVGGLLDLVQGLGPVLACPLLVVLSQEHRRGRCTAHVAFFAGEGEPIPQHIELKDPIFEWELPYLSTPAGLVPLDPGLVYAPRAADGRFGLFLLDAINPSALRYKSVVDSSALTRPDGVAQIGAWVHLPFASTTSHAPELHSQPETIVCADGRTLLQYLSGTPPAAGNASDARKPGAGAADSDRSDTEGISTLREFERRANSAGVGAVYRDVVYHLAERGARPELSGRSVRVATKGPPERIVATIELKPGPVLSVSLLLGAIASNSTATEQHDFQPGMTADALLDRLSGLMDGADARPA